MSTVLDSSTGQILDELRMNSADNAADFGEFTNIKTEPLEDLPTDTDTMTSSYYLGRESLASINAESHVDMPTDTRAMTSESYLGTSFASNAGTGEFVEYTGNVTQDWSTTHPPAAGSGPDTGWACCFCGKTFTTESQLGRHMMKMHQGGGERRVHTCDVCGKTFNRKFNMEQHKKLHFDIKPYVCDECGKKFSRQDRLKLHRIGHRLPKL